MRMKLRLAGIALALFFPPLTSVAQSPAQAAFEQGIALGNEGRFAEALPVLTQAANAGHADAQYAVGTMHSSGRGGVASKTAARVWFEKAAAQGHANAAYNLGIHYDQGLETEASPERALGWFVRAAELGHTEGAYNAGHMYLRGEGAAASNESAVRWFRVAADAGLEEGMNAVGYAYRHGLGVQMDWRQASTWFVRAAAKGSTTAKANIQEMTALSLVAAMADEKNGRAYDAVGVYVIGCDHDYFPACLNDGRTAYFGVGRQVDYVRARKSYGKACFEGIEQACLGHARSAVRAPPNNAEEIRIAAERLDTACTAKDYNACHLLAYMHWHDDLFHMYNITRVKQYLARACQDGGMRDSCTSLFSIISAETAASGASSRPPRQSNPIEQFLLNSVTVLTGTMQAMGQAPLSSYASSSTGGSAVDAVALNNARQDRRDFDNYIRQIDAGARVATCRPGNPYC